jgi:DNA-binding SARP family transcriptional activator/tetratricopeptide (TPR) repeat protein
MDTPLFLRTLGLPALFAANGDPIRFRVKKHVALLVYLGVEQRRPLRRDHLADFLWPKASAAEGRHSLATAISVLRAKLGRKALETTRDTIRIADGAVAVDLTRLEAGAVLADDTRPELEVAAFLDGLDVPDADEFLRWKERKQAHLLPAILKAMIILIDRCRRTADSRTMERLADRMMVLDPLSEDAVRAKMESRAFDGDRLTALRVFEEWKESLARELGAAPSDLVEGIAIRLRRRGWERPVHDTIPSVRTDQWRGRPFIGRQAEYRVLYEGWERTQRGEAGHALVRGDSGIGKTTLLERLSTAAGLEGASVSRVQCYELEREIPYSVVTGLVVGLLDRPGATATAPEALAELGRTVPQVRQRFQGLPPSIDSQGETARVRLAEAMYALVLAIAEEHPVILVVDDLHLADDASLAVLHLVIRQSKGQPIMVGLTVRPGELGQSPQAARLLESAGRLGFQTISVPPMTEEEGLALLNSLLQPGEAPPSGAARRALLNAAAGFPMVLELLVQDWQAHGEQSLGLSLGAMTADLAERTEEGAYDQLFERISRALEPVTQNVLNLAAILGHRLNDLDMYSLIDLGLGSTMSGLGRLTGLRVLREGTEGLEFVNELIRACAYRAVPSPVRRQLHSRIADRLLGLGPDAARQCGLEIAWHCIRGARQQEATSYLLLGAEEAICRGASHEAERALSTSLAKLDTLPRYQAIVLLARSLGEQGRWAECLAFAEDHLSQLPRREADYLRALSANARASVQSLTIALVADTLQDLHTVIRDSPDSRVQIEAVNAAARVCNSVRDPRPAREVYMLCQHIDGLALDSEASFSLASSMAALAYLFGDREASLAHLATALRSHGDGHFANAATYRLHAGLGVHATVDGRYEDAIGHHTNALQIATRLGNDDLANAACSNLAVCHSRLGNSIAQMQWAERGVSLLGPQFGGYTELQLAYCKALGHAILNQPTEARGALANTERRMSHDSPFEILRLWSLMKADVHLVLGNDRLAFETAAEVLQGAPDQDPAVNFEGLFSRWVALLGDVQSRLTAALAIVDPIVGRLTSLNALDQAEVLASRVFLKRRVGLPTLDDETEMQTRLLRLPGPVADHLVRMRLLADSSGRSGVMLRA